MVHSTREKRAHDSVNSADGHIASAPTKAIKAWKPIASLGNAIFAQQVPPGPDALNERERQGRPPCEDSDLVEHQLIRRYAHLLNHPRCSLHAVRGAYADEVTPLA